MAWTTPKTWSSGELVTAANVNTHLRDNLNATWHALAIKASDQSVTSSITLITDNDLQLSVAINEKWLLRFACLITGNAAGDFKFAYSFPSGTAYTRLVDYNNNDTLTAVHFTHTSTDNQPVSIGTSTAVNRLYEWGVMFVNGGTAGTFALRWAQDASNATATTLLAGSTLLGMKVG